MCSRDDASSVCVPDGQTDLSESEYGKNDEHRARSRKAEALSTSHTRRRWKLFRMSKDGSCVGLAWWSVSAQNTHVKARREFDGQAVLTVCHGCVDGLTDEARVCNYGLLALLRWSKRVSGSSWLQLWTTRGAKVKRGRS